MTPTEYAESPGTLGEDVWRVHCVKRGTHGIERFAVTGTGAAHCSCRDRRLASRITPIRKLIGSSVCVGLGVDDRANNYGSHSLNQNFLRGSIRVCRLSSEMHG